MTRTLRHFAIPLVSSLAMACAMEATPEPTGSLAELTGLPSDPSGARPVERQLAGPIVVDDAALSAELDTNAWLYVYDSDGIVRGSVTFADHVVCPFDAYRAARGMARIRTAECSGIAGVADLACRVSAPGALECLGTLGEAGLEASLAVVSAPDGDYEGPYDPEPSPEGDSDCAEGQSACGAEGCCPEGMRCGDGECWDPVDEAMTTGG